MKMNDRTRKRSKSQSVARIMGFLLSAVMLLGMIPASIWADFDIGIGGEGNQTSNNGVDGANNLRNGVDGNDDNTKSTGTVEIEVGLTVTLPSNYPGTPVLTLIPQLKLLGGLAGDVVVTENKTPLTYDSNSGKYTGTLIATVPIPSDGQINSYVVTISNGIWTSQTTETINVNVETGSTITTTLDYTAQPPTTSVSIPVNVIANGSGTGALNYSIALSKKEDGVDVVTSFKYDSMVSDNINAEVYSEYADGKYDVTMTILSPGWSFGGGETDTTKTANVIVSNTATTPLYNPNPVEFTAVATGGVNPGEPAKVSTTLTGTVEIESDETLPAGLSVGDFEIIIADAATVNGNPHTNPTSGTAPASVRVNADGSFEIDLTDLELPTDKEAVTYVYEITQQYNGSSINGLTVDNTKYTVSVIVEDKDEDDLLEESDLTISYASTTAQYPDAIEFVNKYSIGQEIELEGKQILTNNPSNSNKKDWNEFTYKITQVTSSSGNTNSTPLNFEEATYGNNNNGDLTFKINVPNYTGTGTKRYYFKIEQTTNGTASKFEGWTLDDGYWIVTVSLTAKDTYTYTSTYYAGDTHLTPSTDETIAFEFTNLYVDPNASADVTIKGIVNVDTVASQNNIDKNSPNFSTIKITEVNGDIQTGTNGKLPTNKSNPITVPNVKSVAGGLFTIKLSIPDNNIHYFQITEMSTGNEHLLPDDGFWIVTVENKDIKECKYYQASPGTEGNDLKIEVVAQTPPTDKHILFIDTYTVEPYVSIGDGQIAPQDPKKASITIRATKTIFDAPSWANTFDKISKKYGTTFKFEIYLATGWNGTPGDAKNARIQSSDTGRDIYSPSLIKDVTANSTTEDFEFLIQNLPHRDEPYYFAIREIEDSVVGAQKRLPYNWEYDKKVFVVKVTVDELGAYNITQGSGESSVSQSAVETYKFRYLPLSENTKFYHAGGGMITSTHRIQQVDSNGNDIDGAVFESYCCDPGVKFAYEDSNLVNNFIVVGLGRYVNDPQKVAKLRFVLGLTAGEVGADNADEMFIARQLVIWEIVTGKAYNYSVSGYSKTSTIKNNIKAKLNSAGSLPGTPVNEEPKITLIVETQNAELQPNGQYKIPVRVEQTSGVTKITGSITLSATGGTLSSTSVKCGDKVYIDVAKGDTGNVSITAITNDYYEYKSEVGTESRGDSQQPMVSITYLKVKPKATYTFGRTNFDNAKFENKYIRYDVALKKWVAEIKRGTESVYTEATEPNAPLAKIPNATTGDIVRFAIKVYNQENVATTIPGGKIIDYIPIGYTFVTDGSNSGWTYDPSTREATYKDDIDLSANTTVSATPDQFDRHVPTGYPTGTTREIYIYLQINENATNGNLTNVAMITQITKSGEVTKIVEDFDSEIPIVDRDKQKDNEINGSGKNEGDEDWEDWADVEIFDVALKKWVYSVKRTEKDLKGIMQPERLIYDKLPEPGNAVTVDPTNVTTGDTVTFAIRVYNQETTNVQVTEIMDYLPKGYIFDSSVEKNWTQVGPALADGSVKLKYTGNDLPIQLKGIDKANRDSEYTGGVDKNGNSIANDRDDYGVKDSNLGYTKSSYIIYLTVKVAPTATNSQLLNHSRITEIKDEDGLIVKDKDSNMKDEKYSDDKSSETDNEITEKGIKGNDEDTYDVAGTRLFDVAIKKWVSHVARPKKNIDTVSTHPEPTNGQVIVPIDVTSDDIVTFSIKVYNQETTDVVINKIYDYLEDGYTFDVTLNAGVWKLAADQPTEANVTKIEYIGAPIPLDGNTKELADTSEPDDFGVLGKYDNNTSAIIPLKVRVNYNAKNNINLKNFARIIEITDDKGSDDVADKDTVFLDNKYDVNNGDHDRDYYDNDLTGDSKNHTRDDDGANKRDRWDEDTHDGAETRVHDVALKKWVAQVYRNGKIITTNDSTVPPMSADTDEPTNGEDIKPQNVAPGDIVTFAIRVYNQETTNVKITEIMDYLPEGYYFDSTVEPNWEIVGTPDSDGVQKLRYIGGNNNVTLGNTTIPTAKCPINLKGQEIGFDRTRIGEIGFYTGSTTVSDYNTNDKFVHTSYIVYLRVVVDEDADNDNLENAARITKIECDEGHPVEDVDSNIEDKKDDEKYDDNEITENGKTGGDEDSHDKAKTQVFDVALKKWVYSVFRDREKNLDGTWKTPKYIYNNLPEPGNAVEYDPVNVTTGDTVTFAIRVYNQETTDVQITELFDYLPKGYIFVNEDGTTTDPKWEKIGELADGTLKLSYKGLAGDPIQLGGLDKDNRNSGNTGGVDNTGASITDQANVYKIGDEAKGDPHSGYGKNSYIIYLTVKVAPTATNSELLNHSRITKITDKDNSEDVEDKDSDLEDIKYPDDEETETDNEITKKGRKSRKPGGAIDGNKTDDEDTYDVAGTRVFDVAIKKWVSRVDRTNKFGTRFMAPVYTHDEPQNGEVIVPADVTANDIVTFAIKVYNQETTKVQIVDIYDYLPQGYTFDKSLNPYWEMVYEATDDPYSLTKLKYVGDPIQLKGNEKALADTDVPSDFGVIGQYTVYADGIAPGATDYTCEAYVLYLKVRVNYDAKNGINLENFAKIISITDDKDHTNGNKFYPEAVDQEGKYTVDVADKDTVFLDDKHDVNNGDHDRDYYDNDLTGDSKNHTRPGHTDGSGKNRWDEDTHDGAETRVYDVAIKKWISALNGSAGGFSEPTTDPGLTFVKVGDMVTFSIRVYNQETTDVVISQITDYLPKGYTFDPNTPGNEGWKVEASTNDDPQNVTKLVYTNPLNLKGQNSSFRFASNGSLLSDTDLAKWLANPYSYKNITAGDPNGTSAIIYLIVRVDEGVTYHNNYNYARITQIKQGPNSVYDHVQVQQIVEDIDSPLKDQRYDDYYIDGYGERVHRYKDNIIDEHTYDPIGTPIDKRETDDDTHDGCGVRIDPGENTTTTTRSTTTTGTDTTTTTRSTTTTTGTDTTTTTRSTTTTTGTDTTTTTRSTTTTTGTDTTTTTRSTTTTTGTETTTTGTETTTTGTETTTTGTETTTTGTETTTTGTETTTTGTETTTTGTETTTTGTETTTTGTETTTTGTETTTTGTETTTTGTGTTTTGTGTTTTGTGTTEETTITTSTTTSATTSVTFPTTVGTSGARRASEERGFAQDTYLIPYDDDTILLVDENGVPLAYYEIPEGKTFDEVVEELEFDDMIPLGPMPVTGGMTAMYIGIIGIAILGIGLYMLLSKDSKKRKSNS